MTPRLRVSAGPSPSSLSPVSVNSDQTHEIRSDEFEGKILAYIKGFTDEAGKILDHDYFSSDDRKGVSWSIQVQGRFLQPRSADNILFGNMFDRPLKLPWGVSAAFKVMKYMDPTLEHDLASQTQPWALSPLISSTPYLSHVRGTAPAFPGVRPLQEDTSQISLASKNVVNQSNSDSKSPYLSSSAASSRVSVLSTSSSRSSKGKKNKKSPEAQLNFGTPGDRRSYFTQAEHRKGITFGPDDVVTIDFCYGYLEFTPSISLRLPGGFSVDLMNYWDGQQVKFICCERGEGNPPMGKMFWCVVLEMADKDPEENAKKGETGNVKSDEVD